MQADFRRTTRPGLHGAAGDFLEIDFIGRATLRFGAAFGEGAEPAFIEADIGIVDVAVDDVSYRVVGNTRAQIVGGGEDARGVFALGGKQRDDFALIQPFAGQSAVDAALNGGGAGAAASGGQGWHVAAFAGVPAIGHGQAAGIDHAADGFNQGFVQPNLRLLGESRADGEALAQHTAGGFGRFLQRGKVRPRGFRVHVVGRHRRDPAPIIHPGLQQGGQLAWLQIGRRLDGHGRP